MIDAKQSTKSKLEKVTCDICGNRNVELLHACNAKWKFPSRIAALKSIRTASKLMFLQRTRTDWIHMCACSLYSKTSLDAAIRSTIVQET